METPSIQSVEHFAPPLAAGHAGQRKHPEQQRVKAQQSPQPAANGTPSDLDQAMRDLEARFKVKVELTQDEETGRQLVRIKSPDGKRILRQIPPESVLEMAHRTKTSQGQGLLTSVA